MARKFNTGQRGGSLHKEGVYHMRIEDAEEKTSQTSGNDYLNIRLAVLKNGKPFGSSVWDIIVLNEASEWRLIQLMDSIEAPENQDVDAEWLKGKECYGRVVIDDYNDDDRNKVKGYMIPARAIKLMNDAANGVGEDSLMAVDNGSKAAKRSGAKKNQPEEFAAEEAMPL